MRVLRTRHRELAGCEVVDQRIVIGQPIASIASGYGNSGHTVLATHGGFVELLVRLNDNVSVGQRVAIQRNTFGEVVAEYTSDVAGEVTARRSDATAEPFCW